jgi:hypothetical protein
VGGETGRYGKCGVCGLGRCGTRRQQASLLLPAVQ